MLNHLFSRYDFVALCLFVLVVYNFSNKIDIFDLKIKS